MLQTLRAEQISPKERQRNCSTSMQTMQGDEESSDAQRKEKTKEIKKEDWSNEQRTNFSRAHYLLHHGHTDLKMKMPTCLRRGCKTNPMTKLPNLTVDTTTTLTKLDERANKLWDAQANAPANMNYVNIPRQQLNNS